MSRTRVLAPLLAVVAVLSTGLLASANTSDEHADRPSSTWTAKKRTLDYLRAIEREDLRAVEARMSPDSTLVHPITFSGNQEPDAVFTGREQVLDYVSGLFDGMSRIEFSDVRVTVSAGGRQSFVEADGNFVTADGRPYRNVYMLRFDWGADGRITSAAEYYNPIIFCRTFQQNPYCAG